MKVGVISSNGFDNRLTVIRPNFFLNDGRKRIDRIIRLKKPISTLAQLVESIHSVPIFKRVFVEDSSRGYPYITASQMMKRAPRDEAKYISKVYTPYLDEGGLKANQIMVSCAGSIGNIRLITSDLEGSIGSQDIIRVNHDPKKAPWGFIYAYLASNTAYQYLQSLVYGSVVPRLEPKSLQSLPVPLFPYDLQQEIHGRIEEAARFESRRIGYWRRQKKRSMIFCQNPKLLRLDLEQFHPRRYLVIIRNDLTLLHTSSTGLFEIKSQIDMGARFPRTW